jgi:hypothetical protein
MRASERSRKRRNQKKHCGSRSEQGTRVAALFYSLIKPAKLSDVEPSAYLGEAAGRAIPDPGRRQLSAGALVERRLFDSH